MRLITLILMVKLKFFIVIFIDVNEHGTEAAAVTYEANMGTSLYSMPPTTDFIVDCPFIFMIREVTSETPIFIGDVVNPLPNLIITIAIGKNYLSFLSFFFCVIKVLDLATFVVNLLIFHVLFYFYFLYGFFIAIYALYYY